MRRPGDRPSIDALAVDVHALLERCVASLYSHLVTRPTGRAVRMAIEGQIGELGSPTLSMVDLSAVSILDYSCADEVVAKLLIRYGDSDEAGPFFILKGVQHHHREPIEAVLERHELWIVAETAPGRHELLGPGFQPERLLWLAVEEQGKVPRQRVRAWESIEGTRTLLDRLLRRRLVFLDPLRGDLHALSHLANVSHRRP